MMTKNVASKNNLALEQKRLENHEIYYIGASEQHKWRTSPKMEVPQLLLKNAGSNFPACTKFKFNKDILKEFLISIMAPKHYGRGCLDVGDARVFCCSTNDATNATARHKNPKKST